MTTHNLTPRNEVEFRDVDLLQSSVEFNGNLYFEIRSINNCCDSLVVKIEQPVVQTLNFIRKKAGKDLLEDSNIIPFSKLFDYTPPSCFKIITVTPITLHLCHQKPTAIEDSACTYYCTNMKYLQYVIPFVYETQLCDSERYVHLYKSTDTLFLIRHPNTLDGIKITFYDENDALVDTDDALVVVGSRYYFTKKVEVIMFDTNIFSWPMIQNDSL